MNYPANVQRGIAKRRASVRFEARYPSTCEECGDRIEVGDTLRWEDDAAVHANCEPAVEPATEVCPRCWLAVSVGGACGCED